MRRSKTEIFLDILKFLVLDGSLRVSHLMRKVNLPYDRVALYLKFAVNNFIVNKKGQFYTITSFGLLIYKECKGERLLRKNLDEYFKKREEKTASTRFS